MTEKYKKRLNQLDKVLKSDIIDEDSLRTCCIAGIPDTFRPLCWRIFLGYLPVNRSEWPHYLQKQRENYTQLVVDFIIRPGSDAKFDLDHPLNLNSDSYFGHFFRDNETLLQIDRDVRRLCPEMDFFQRPTLFPNKMTIGTRFSMRIDNGILNTQELRTHRLGAVNLVSSRKVALEQYRNLENDQEAHWEVVERILFIYSKLNPGIKYVQGMNEIIGPLYYVFSTDIDSEWTEFCESDTFYCFQNLMSEIKDNFIKTLDQSNCGIEWTMGSFFELLKNSDPVLYAHLVEKQGLKPQFFAFRWLTLLLSQEFPLPDVITIWDSLFADCKRFEFLQFISLAMLQNARNQLIEGDFSTNMKLLQVLIQSLKLLIFFQLMIFFLFFELSKYGRWQIDKNCSGIKGRHLFNCRKIAFPFEKKIIQI